MTTNFLKKYFMHKLQSWSLHERLHWFLYSYIHIWLFCVCVCVSSVPPLLYNFMVTWRKPNLFAFSCSLKRNSCVGSIACSILGRYFPLVLIEQGILNEQKYSKSTIFFCCFLYLFKYKTWHRGSGWSHPHDTSYRRKHAGRKLLRIRETELDDSIESWHYALDLKN